MHQLDLQILQKAVKEAAAFRCRTRLQPAGGEGDKVFPPTYVGGIYAVEDRRIDGRVVRCVLLDSVQSQANRMEEALQDAFLPNWREVATDGEEPRCDIPVVAVHIENHGWVTSFTAPHRIHDAILRDSNLNGTRFRQSEIGQSIVNARVWNATPFYQHCPTALLFGTWDSTAGEGLDSAKIPRAIVSEIVAVNITAGVRTGSRIDPLGIRAQSATIYRRTDGDWAMQNEDRSWTGATEGEIARDKKGNPKKFGKGKPSDINHGNVTPDMPRFEKKEVRDQQLNRLPNILDSTPVKLRYEIESADGRLASRTTFDGDAVRIREGALKPGGVTMEYALHTWTLSLTQLRRLRFPVAGNHDDEQNSAARTVLAALGLYAFALQQERGHWLRSRCELIPQMDDDSASVFLEQLNTDGSTDHLVLPTVKMARNLLNDACDAAQSVFQPESNDDSRPQQREGEDLLPNPGWEQRVIRLTPTDTLVELVRRSDARQPEDEQEEPEAVNADVQG